MRNYADNLSCQSFNNRNINNWFVPNPSHWITNGTCHSECPDSIGDFFFLMSALIKCAADVISWVLVNNNMAEDGNFQVVSNCFLQNIKESLWQTFEEVLFLGGLWD